MAIKNHFLGYHLNPALIPLELKIANLSFTTVKIAETANPGSANIDICAVIKTNNLSIEIKTSADFNILK